ncbi:UDP-N-acetylglucosamine 2-epimerase [Alteromonas sp. S167]|uniref:UDP-N-acetylglucosamine 2-epimerase n=1 Tax=Alteromonas sp. S167 TaxID=3117402 RepID=UPI002FE21AB8
MSKRYVLFAALPYSYSILRPIQSEIRKRGGEVAWYLEPSCEDLLLEDERRLATVEELVEFNPDATLTPGNYIYHFIPGIKVGVFHGYFIGKRGEQTYQEDSHFRIRGWFDLICTQGPSSTAPYKILEEQHGSFKAYETGWCKVDTYVKGKRPPVTNPPTILYGTTFTKGISSAEQVFSTIEKLAKEREWNWILTFHPKLHGSDIVERYKQLAASMDNVKYLHTVDLDSVNEASVLLCDSSSIILEFMMQEKPVVTFRNTNPGPHLIDVTEADKIEEAIDYALTKPSKVIDEINAYVDHHEKYRDGHNSERVLDAIDDFILNYKGKLKPHKPGIWRKFQMRKKTGYWK